MSHIQIPKKIHYCWFGNKEFPPLVKKCIISWKRCLPEYEFKLWNEENFNIESNNWCKEAYKHKKYAFVADYVRLEVLYKYGGIYLDTDIKMYKTLNPFLSNHAFMGFERDDVLSMGVMGFHKSDPIIKELLDYYNQPFRLDIISKLESNANVTTAYLSAHYGLTRDNKEQTVGGIHVYPKTYFNPMDYFGNWDKSKNTICCHLYMGSWLPEEEQKKLKFRKTLLFKVCKTIWNRTQNITAINKLRIYIKKKNII